MGAGAGSRFGICSKHPPSWSSGAGRHRVVYELAHRLPPLSGGITGNELICVSAMGTTIGAFCEHRERGTAIHARFSVMVAPGDRGAELSTSRPPSRVAVCCWVLDRPIRRRRPRLGAPAEHALPCDCRHHADREGGHRARAPRRAEVLRDVHGYLLSRNSRVEEDLVDQLFNSSEKRLARVLLLMANFGKESKPEPVIAKISQETLAEMVGHHEVAREHVHEQVPQARVHRIQRHPGGPQFPAERGVARQSPPQEEADDRD